MEHAAAGIRAAVESKRSVVRKGAAVGEINERCRSVLNQVSAVECRPGVEHSWARAGRDRVSAGAAQEPAAYRGAVIFDLARGRRLDASQAEVDGDELADRVAVADLEPRRLALVGHVLGAEPERGEGIDGGAGADARVPAHDHVRGEAHAVAQFHVRPHGRERADRHAGAKTRLRIDDRGRVDVGHDLSTIMAV